MVLSSRGVVSAERDDVCEKWSSVPGTWCLVDGTAAAPAAPCHVMHKDFKTLESKCLSGFLFLFSKTTAREFFLYSSVKVFLQSE